MAGVEDVIAEPIREAIDDGLDKVEDAVAKMKDGLKKTAITGLINTVRAILGVPDDIGGDEG